MKRLWIYFFDEAVYKAQDGNRLWAISDAVLQKRFGKLTVDGEDMGYSPLHCEIILSEIGFES